MVCGGCREGINVDAQCVFLDAVFFYSVCLSRAQCFSVPAFRMPFR